MNYSLAAAIITIKKATISDIPIIQHIVEETWPQTYTTILGKDQVDYMLQMMYNTNSLTEQIQNHHHFFIAFKDALPIGFAAFSNVRNDIYKLQKLYVLPITQKTGAGKALLQKVETEAKKMSAKKLQLNVNRHNAAKFFYEKNGFTVVEEADIDIGNGYFMNDYIMQKDL